MTSTGFWKFLKFNLLLIFLFCLVNSSWAQEDDSTFLNTEEEVEFFTEISDLDPNKAAIFSALLPGLGQAYNRQYWKIPIVFGVFLGIYQGVRYNQGLYNDFTNALRAEQDLDPNTINRFGSNVSTEFLSRNRDQVRRNRDFLIILGVVAYLINIVEAHVAAHLHEFQVNERLSMNLEPKIESTPLVSRSLGLSFTLNF